MKTSHHGSSRVRRFGSSLAVALAFVSLSLGVACDVEEGDVPLEDRLEVLSAEELEQTGIFLETPQSFEEVGLSEEEVAAVQASFDDLVAEDDVAQAPICFCFNDCLTCCDALGSQQCVTTCNYNCP